MSTTSFQVFVLQNRTDGHAGQYHSTCTSSAGDVSATVLATCCLESNDELLMPFQSLTSLSIPPTLLLSALPLTAWTIPFIRLVFPASSFLVSSTRACLRKLMSAILVECLYRAVLTPCRREFCKVNFTNYVIPNYIYFLLPLRRLRWSSG